MNRGLVSLTVFVCLTVFSSSGTGPSLYGNAGLLASYPAGSTPEKPSIKSITTGPKIIWDSQFGKAYQVLWSLSPGGPWEPFGETILGTGEEMYVYDDRAEGRTRFYRLEITDVTPPGMAAIPGGTYEMGDHFGIDQTCYGPYPIYSLPVHTVRVDSFYMDATEVTNAGFCAFLNTSMSDGDVWIDPRGTVSTTGDRRLCYCLIRFVDARGREFIGSDLRYNGPSGAFRIVPAREDHPAFEVGWHGAAAYCNWRSDRQGLERCYNPETWECDFEADGYRLPTEAEWEYAARGGLRYALYPWGDEIDGSKANYAYSGDPHDDDWDTGIGVPTTPVASYAPNGYGLYDMAGNALELCNDYFKNAYYQYCVDNAITDNPTGPPPQHDDVHVQRGGSCFSGPACLSCSARYPDRYVPNHSGFRCVRRPGVP